MQNMYAPMAQAVQSQGRGGDSMLVHMTPGEVGGLQALARAAGGSLTTNPETGLPEAGFLSNILPTILGIGLAATGVGAPLAAGIVGAGQTALTGDIGKGLMAGLGAFGGASLAGGLGIGKIGEQATQLATENIAQETGKKALEAGATGAGRTFGGGVYGMSGGVGAGTGAINPTFFQKFSAISENTLPFLGKTGSNIAAGTGLLGGLGAFEQPEYQMPESDELTADDVPQYGALELDPRIDPRYPRGEISFFRNNPAVRIAEGGEVPERGLGATLAAQLPQFTQQFQTSPGPISGVPFGYGEGQSPSEQIRASILAAAEAEPEDTGVVAPGGEPMYDIARGPSSPANYLGGMPYFNPGSLMGGAMLSPEEMLRIANMAKGGEVPLQSGGFVMPARETAEFGNGSTMAGQQRLAQIGGIPIRGAGDGVSDSIPARIDGQQPAAVANGETYFPPKAVEAMGGANQMRDMMKRAQQSRMNAGRGSENRIKGFAMGGIMPPSVSPTGTMPPAEFKPTNVIGTPVAPARDLPTPPMPPVQQGMYAPMQRASLSRPDLPMPARPVQQGMYSPMQSASLGSLRSLGGSGSSMPVQQGMFGLFGRGSGKPGGLTQRPPAPPVELGDIR